MAKVKITQVKSSIKTSKNQKANLAALGLGKINKSVEIELGAVAQGMVNKVVHLVEITEL